MFIKGDTILDILPVLQSMLGDKIKELELKAREQMPEVAKLIPYPKCRDYTIENTSIQFSDSSSNWFTNTDHWRGTKPITSSEGLKTRFEAIKATLEKIEKDCKAVEDQNTPLIENNLQIHQKVKLMMKGIGIKDSYSVQEYSSSRSRTLKWVTKSAGYLADLARDVPVSVYGKINTKELLRSVEQVYNTKLQEIKKVEIEADRQKKEIENTNKMAMLRVKYTPNNPMSTKYDMLHAILDKNKYLRLAYFLEKDRGDWSDGYDYAEQGLNGFEVETEEDGLIYDDIQGHIDDWCGDGRVFRATKYNYDVLYNMVEDEQLHKDLQQIIEIIGEY